MTEIQMSVLSVTADNKTTSVILFNAKTKSKSEVEWNSTSDTIKLLRNIWSKWLIEWKLPVIATVKKATYFKCGEVTILAREKKVSE